MRHAPLAVLAIAYGLLLTAPVPGQAKAPRPAVVLPVPAEAAGGHVIVTAKKAKILAAPAAGLTVLKSVERGDTLPVEGKRGSWYFVRLSTSARGWIHADAVADYEFPAYLLRYQPPDDWVPPSPNWVPPPDWIPPATWKKRPASWAPPPRWRPRWWDRYAPRDTPPPEKSGKERRPPPDLGGPQPPEGHGPPGDMQKPRLPERGERPRHPPR